jgi:hypothetical protein
MRARVCMFDERDRERGGGGVYEITFLGGGSLTRLI